MKNKFSYLGTIMSKESLKSLQGGLDCSDPNLIWCFSDSCALLIIRVASTLGILCAEKGCYDFAFCNLCGQSCN